MSVSVGGSSFDKDQYQEWWDKASPQLSSHWKSSQVSVPPWDHRLINDVFYGSASEPFHSSEGFNSDAKLILNSLYQSELKAEKKQQWKKKYALGDLDSDADLELKSYLNGTKYREQTKCGPSLELAHAYMNQFRNNFSTIVLTLSPYSLINVAKIAAWKKIQEKFKVPGEKNPKLYVAINKRFFTYYAEHLNILRINACLISTLLCEVDFIEITDPWLDKKAGQEVLWVEEKLESLLTQYLVLKEETHVNQKFVAGTNFIEAQSDRIYQSAINLIELSEKSKQEKKEELMKTWVQEDWEFRVNQIQTKKIILSGVNDFIDLSDDYAFKPDDFKIENFSQDWEKLRSASMACGLRDLPWKAIIIGPKAGLGPRISFTENFFKAIGVSLEFLESVVDVSKLKQVHENFLVLCGSDETYSQVSWSTENTMIVAGELSGVTLPPNIFPIHRKISSLKFWIDFVHLERKEDAKIFKEYGL
ncbi:MAG: hypothetical protein QE271_07650 [Bacteriovoracaceae bacterium]|nr:hypothetical protein [Bacteriovoracaceae bacterium]